MVQGRRSRQAALDVGRRRRMCVPAPCTSSRTRAHNRTNVQLWCASPHECALLQQATSRFVPIYFVRYLSGLTPPPIRLTNQPKTAATTPQKPAPASSKTDPESERHHQCGLGLGARRRAPNDGSNRHAAAPHTRHRNAGQQRRRTRQAAPHPSRAAAQPQPQHRR